MELKDSFGNRLRSIRLKNKLSQEELAYFLGIRPATLSCLENGKSFLSANLLEKLCEVLRVQPCELFDFNEIRPEAEAEEIIQKINYTLPQLSIEKLKYINKIIRIFADKD